MRSDACTPRSPALFLQNQPLQLFGHRNFGPVERREALHHLVLRLIGEGLVVEAGPALLDEALDDLRLIERHGFRTGYCFLNLLR